MTGGSDEAEDSLVGRVLAGVYRLQAEIGRGAMGVVYRAQHVTLGEPCAVKVLSPELAQDEHLRARFLQEARALTRLSHRSIVPMRHFGDEAGLLYVVMGFAEGETLTALLEREGPLPEPRARAITEQVLEALTDAHRVGVVHRDLKPDNIMVQARTRRSGTLHDHVLVLDFGLARILGDTLPLIPGGQLTLDGDIVGTVAYMSPEQVRAARDVDERSDLYSVGVILYELLSGRCPFDSGSPLSIIARILEAQPAPLRDIAVADISDTMQAVVTHALAKEPAARFASADEFLAALRGERVPPARLPPPAIAGEGPEAPLHAARARGARRAGLGLLAVLLAFGAWRLLGRDRTPADERALAEAALGGCEPRTALAHLARLERRSEPTGEDRLLAAEARLALGDRTADRDLAEAARLLGEGDPRVQLAWARYYATVQVPPDPVAALAQFARAAVRDEGGTGPLLARAQMLLDATTEPALAAAGHDRLRMLANDVAALVARAPADPRVVLLQGRLAMQDHDADLPLAERMQRISEAAALYERAAELDTDAADPLHFLGQAWMQRSRAMKLAGRYDEMHAAFVEALRAFDRSIERVEAHPLHACQGRRRTRFYEARIASRLQAGEVEGALEDVKRIGKDTTDVGTLAGVADALRNAGRYEDAIALYERLTEATQMSAAWFNLGVCHERRGLTLRLAGRRDEARAAYARAVVALARSVDEAPDMPQFRAYVGEARLRLSELEEGRRAEHLAAAGADFDRATADWSAGLDKLELDYRRAEWLCRVGRSAEAVHAMEAIVAGQHGMNASAYARAAQVEMVHAVVTARAGDRAHLAALLETAAGRVAEVRAIQAKEPGGALSLTADLALVRALLAEQQAGSGRTSDLESAREAYAALAALDDDDQGGHDRALLGLAEVAELQSAPEGPVARQHLEDLAGGYFRATSGFYGVLAQALEARGDAAGAARARAAALRSAP